MKALDLLGQIPDQEEPCRTRGPASAARMLPWAPPRPSWVRAPACMVVVLIFLYDMSTMKAWLL